MLDPALAEKIKTALKRLNFGEVEEVTADLRIDDLGIDSVTLSELIVLLEEDYTIDIESEELFSLETFGELEALLNKKD
jgi:acyl carrier protein